MLVFPYASRQQRLRAYVRTAATCHLFTEPTVLTESLSAKDFTEPPPETGYRPLPIQRLAWRIEPVELDVRAISAAMRFQLADGRAVVRGHYGLDKNGELLWSELLVKVVPQPTGDPIVVPQPFEFLRPDDALEITVMLDSVNVGLEVRA